MLTNSQTQRKERVAFADTESSGLNETQQEVERPTAARGTSCHSASRDPDTLRSCLMREDAHEWTEQSPYPGESAGGGREHQDTLHSPPARQPIRHRGARAVNSLHTAAS